MRDIYDRIAFMFGFRIDNFFIDYNNFLSYDVRNLVSYLNGDTGVSVDVSLKNLRLLSGFADKIYGKMSENRALFDTAEYFDIIDEFEDCKDKLLTYFNLDKWLGVNTFRALRMQSNAIDYTLVKNESLDSVAIGMAGYDNRDIGGLELAIQNQTKELDYTLDGGYIFQFNYGYIGGKRGLRLQTVIDRDVRGKKLYSQDLSRKIEFIDNDLLTLPHKETFEQTCQINLELKRGDNPEFPFDGIDKTLLVNEIIVTTAMPIVLRQMGETVAKDDTIRKFLIKDVWYDKDAIFFECEFYSHLTGDTYVTVNKNEN